MDAIILTLFSACPGWLPQALSALAFAGFGASVAGGVLHVALMQAAYHIQLLAMSSSLASPGVQQTVYRAAADYFKW